MVHCKIYASDYYKTLLFIIFINVSLKYTKITYGFLFFLHSRRHLRHCAVNCRQFSQIWQLLNPINGQRFVRIQLASSKRLTHPDRVCFQLPRWGKVRIKFPVTTPTTLTSNKMMLINSSFSNACRSFCRSFSSFFNHSERILFLNAYFENPSWRQNTDAGRPLPMIHLGWRERMLRSFPSTIWRGVTKKRKNKLF